MPNPPIGDLALTIASQSAAAVSASVANPSLITLASRLNVVAGGTVTISGWAGSTPSLNASWQVVSVLSPTTFTINANVTVAGTGAAATVTSAAATYHLVLANAPTGGKAFARYNAPPLNPLISQGGDLDYTAQNPDEGITLSVTDFSLGCGHYRHHEERDPFGNLRTGYALGENVDTRWRGIVVPGPREVADLAGIASGYDVTKRISHNAVSYIITNNGTNTKVYYVAAGAWTLAETVNAAVATDLVSFGGVVAVAYGSAKAYRFSSDNGATWADSTKTGNAKYATWGCAQQAGATIPKVAYVRDNNELYFTQDLTNAGASVGPSLVGDANNDEFNSLVEDISGTLLIGKRRFLYSIDSAGIVHRVAGPYRYIASGDDGFALAANNFRDPVQLLGKVYYRVEDYRLIEVDQGAVTEDLQPGAFGPQIWRMGLPINGLAAVNGYLCVAIGTTNFAAIRDVSISTGGSLVSDGFTNVSELYMGRYDPDGVWRWHGIFLRCTLTLVRYLWADDATAYLYLAKRGQAQTRAYVAPVNPVMVMNSSAVNLTTQTWLLETGLYAQRQLSVDKTERHATAETGPLGATAASIQLNYRTLADDVTGGYSAVATYTSSAAARLGTAYPAATTYRQIRFKIAGAPAAAPAVGSDYAVIYGFQSMHLFVPQVNDIIAFTVEASSGTRLPNGGMNTMSWQQIRAVIDAWKNASTPATVVDEQTGDSWPMRLESFREMGFDSKRQIAVTAHQAAV